MIQDDRAGSLFSVGKVCKQDTSNLKWKLRFLFILDCSQETERKHFPHKKDMGKE